MVAWPEGSSLWSSPADRRGRPLQMDALDALTSGKGVKIRHGDSNGQDGDNSNSHGRAPVCEDSVTRAPPVSAAIGGGGGTTFTTTNAITITAITITAITITAITITASLVGEDFVAVKVRDIFNRPAPQQNWPVYRGSFKCLVMLHPGPNRIDVELVHEGAARGSRRVVAQYQPLSQLPPLFLAVLVARDSPQLLDCPPAKRGAISSAHASLDAAVVKLRMAAYIWQAATAEAVRKEGLGRRAFRLDEEWGVDTTTAASLQQGGQHHDPDPTGTGGGGGGGGDGGARMMMDAVARVHVVRSDKTVAQLRDAEAAQQNHRGRQRHALRGYFAEALAQHGGPFARAARPVVAGLILDTHYDVGQGLILGHLAAGEHAPRGLSLAVFGSHTTYAWPRFLEEVPACLLDRTPTGDAGMSLLASLLFLLTRLLLFPWGGRGGLQRPRPMFQTMGDACGTGLAGMFGQVKLAFGSEGDVSKTAVYYPDTIIRAVVAQPRAIVQHVWEMPEILKVLRKDHFKLPDDRALTSTQLESPTILRCNLDENDEVILEASCLAGLARVRFFTPASSDIPVKEINFLRKNPTFQTPTNFTFSVKQLEAEFDRTEAIAIEIVANMWTLLADLPFIKVPGTSLVLAKRSVVSPHVHDSPNQFWRWATLLKRKHRSGGSQLTFANRIDIHVGATMDGAIVHFQDGTRCNCGRANQTHFGGSDLRRALSEADVFKIARVSLFKGRNGWTSLDGCRMTHGDGESWGQLQQNGNQPGVQHLACAPDERIVGFYGRSELRSGFTSEFGIITAPRDVVDGDEGLPRQVYDMPELTNTDGGLAEHGNHDNDDDDDDDDDEEDDWDEEEEED
ncbi:putative peptidase family-domain-containing protein [Xylariaceae sp. FL0804]|nr:putative peptidase family-domain-containing protein [Xylariaceae sp. FL0804]